MNDEKNSDIQAIIGLGNPGPAYYHHRHSIGFRVVDALAQRFGGQWRSREDMELAEVIINGKKIILIKPQTFMNASGRVIPYLTKRGIKPENILVVHDELEQPFGKVSFKMGGSARGHNGLRSIIGVCGDQFYRLRCGIGRPEQKEQVPSYVLQNFLQTQEQVEELIEAAVVLIEQSIKE